MTYVALLRGINVGGKHKIDMKELKAAFEDVGMDDVETYINSGNVIFRNDRLDRLKLASTLESAIESTFGFQVPVYLRNADGFLALVDTLPDCWVNDKDVKCDVLFLSDALDREKTLEQFTIKPEIDDVRYFPGAVLWRVDRTLASRSGMKRLAGTKLYEQMTLRNCNTVRKLGAMLRVRK